MRPPVSFHHPRYEILGLLGEGGMGRVFLARDRLEGNRRVALKLYPARYYHERLRREFIALRELHHPAIARALHFGISEPERAPFFTLEHIEGVPLMQYLGEGTGGSRPSRRRERPGLLEDALWVFVCIASAVAYLHRRGVLHLDIKPGNILVVDMGPEVPPRPVLIDFGLVRPVEATPTGVGHGTLPFMSPELVAGGAPTPASDVYSLGATFYRVLSGRYPVPGDEAGAIARARRPTAIPPIPEVPSDVEKVILRALARDPTQRFRDAGELHHALHQQPVARHLGARGGRHPVVYHEPDFVGRGRELKDLRAWVSGDRRARPIFEVSADGGWGKSRFLERAITVLEVEGKKAIFVRSREDADLTLPETCLQHVEVLSGRAASDAAGNRTPRKRRIGRPAPKAVPEDPELLVRRSVSRLLPFLREDTFLVVDDLHLGTKTDIRLVAEVARALSASATPPGGGMLIGRRKPDSGVDPGEEWSGLSTTVELGALELQDALEIDLEGLDGALSEVSRDKARRLKTQLFHRTGGHPLLYVRGLLDLAGETAVGPEAASPDQVAGDVLRVPGPPRRLAIALACLGRAADASELASILSEDIRSLTAAIHRLRQAGFLAVEDGRARILHESFRDGVLRNLGAEERTSMHEEIARHLMRGRRPFSRAEAAWHLLESGSRARALDLAEEWVRAGMPAPGTSLDRGAALLLRAAGVLPHGTERADGFIEAAAEALERLGRYEDALRALDEVVVPAHATAAPRTVAEVRRRRMLGALCHRTGRTERALETLSWCVTRDAEAVAPLEALHALVELSLLQHFLGQVDAALDHARRGVRIWRAAPPSARGTMLEHAIQLHGILGQIHIRQLRFHDAVAVLHDGLRLAEKGRSLVSVAVLLNNLALAHHLAGHFSPALGMFRRAEALALELEDPSALASIRANIAQILAKTGRFRAAREMLDELEESPAIRQSKRLRLGCLYSRGLLWSFMRADAGEIWSAVEGLAREVGDTFLARLATVYRAEGMLLRGALSAARPLLTCDEGEWTTDPMVSAVKTARRAWLEALAGRPSLATELRQELRHRAPELPGQLLAWSRYYSGCSALETEDWAEARQDLQVAAKQFAGMSYTVGIFECRLSLADLLLRAGEAMPGFPGSVEDEIRRARSIDLEMPGNTTVRTKTARVALLEARLALARLLGAATGRAARSVRAGRRPCPPAGGADPLALASDFLAGAAGDSSIASDPDAAQLVEVLACAVARLQGNEAVRSAAHSRESALRAEYLAGLAPDDRESCSRRDAWARYGLASLRPCPAIGPLGAGHVAAIAAILRGDSPAPTASPADVTASVQEALAAISEATSASRLDIVCAGEVVATLSGTRERGAHPARGEVPDDGVKPEGRAAVASPAMAHLARLVAPCGPAPPTTILVARKAPGGFSQSDGTFLELAACGLSPRIDRLLGRGTAGRAPLPGRSGRGRAGAADEATAALPRGSRPARPGAEDLARIARDSGLVVTPSIGKLLPKLGAYAATDLPVLITGESGTGKNLLARLLHGLSPRRDGPFLVQNASAIPPELFEADLFGYESGAFTSAEHTRTGFLFRAQGGTFHLEEIGDLGVPAQQLLLRVMEEKSVRPLGATGPRPLDVRFVASTHRDVDALLRQGELRKDLFFRLNAARIHVGPLRERPEDIPELVANFWAELKGPRSRFPRSALEALLEHSWPGNVRELLSVLRRLALDSSASPTAAEARAVLGEMSRRSVLAPEIFASHRYEDVLRMLEESHLKHLHEKHSGNIEAIAAELGTSTRSIYRRFEKLGLKPRDLRRGTT